MDATEETRQSRHNQEVMCSIIMFDYLSLLYVALSLSRPRHAISALYTGGHTMVVPGWVGQVCTQRTLLRHELVSVGVHT